MKTSVIVVLLLFFMASPSPVLGADGPIYFGSNPYIVYENGAYLLRVPDIRIEGTGIWAQWILDFSDSGWAFSAAGLMADISGTQTGTGAYLYDEAMGVIVIDIETSVYVGCGVENGLVVFRVEPPGITNTTMNLAELNPRRALEGREEEKILFSRPGGELGDITGSWTAPIGSGSLTITLTTDGSLVFDATINDCDGGN